MKKTIEISWNELWPIANILNEVCHGINIHDFEKEVGFIYNYLIPLFHKLSNHESEETKHEIKEKIELEDKEIEIIKICFNEVLKQIEEWEFPTRVGISIQEAKTIINKLT